MSRGMLRDEHNDDLLTSSGNIDISDAPSRSAKGGTESSDRAPKDPAQRDNSKL